MREEKPNILLGWGREWWCYSNNGFMGIGRTVLEAYANWKEKNRK